MIDASSFKERLVEIKCGSELYRGLISGIDESNDSITLCAVHKNGKKMPTSSALKIRREQITDINFLSALTLEDLSNATGKSPRKPQADSKPGHHECFEVDDSEINEDFDFAGNLKKWDKEAESRRFDQEYGIPSASHNNGGSSRKSSKNSGQNGQRERGMNIEHLNGAVQHQPSRSKNRTSSNHYQQTSSNSSELQQNSLAQNSFHMTYKLPRESYASYKYIMEYRGEEYSVPAMTPEAWCGLMDATLNSGFTIERVTEAVAALSVTPIKRFLLSLPRKCERVLMLCGPHMNGAVGMALARHLSLASPDRSGQGVHVTCFFPASSRKSCGEIQSEIRLINKCDVLFATSVRDLEKTYDVIVDALDCVNFEYVQVLDWYQEVMSWLRRFQSPVIAIHPPTTYSRSASFVLAIALPLAWNCPVLLCNAVPPHAFMRGCGIHISQNSSVAFPVNTFHELMPLQMRDQRNFFASWTKSGAAFTYS